MNTLANYTLTILVLIGLDSVWLGIIAKDFNKKHLEHLLRDKFEILPAILFYLIYAAGLIYFVINPGVENKNLTKTVLSGAFFGLICYSTFDLTSLAAFKDWSIKLTIIDILWGTLMTGITIFIVMKIRG